MEKNVEIKILQTYFDIEEQTDIPRGKTIWVTEKRVKELAQKIQIKLIQIVRKGV